MADFRHFYFFRTILWNCSYKITVCVQKLIHWKFSFLYPVSCILYPVSCILYHKCMRIAIFHDYLNQFGGAERVLKVLLSLFPKAHLYTLLYDKNKTFEIFDDNIKKTSFLDKPFVINNHRMFIPLMPFASQKMHFIQRHHSLA